MKKAVDAGIKVAVFDTAVSGEILGVTVSQQDDASLTELSFGQLVKDFNGKANIVVVGGGLPADGAPSGGLPDAAEAKSGD